MHAREDRPVVASYCATFLKPEMLHIYRQLTALERVRPVVIARKREEEERFPFDDLVLVPKPVAHELRRFWFRKIRRQPAPISSREIARLLHALQQTHAQLLHVYFGHIAVQLLPLIRAWDKPCLVSFHGADVLVDMDKRAYRDATREMLDVVPLVLVRSESLAEAVRALGCPPEKIRLQRTGLPLGQFTFRARSAPEDGRWRLLQVGRLIEKKGFATSLRAFARLAAAYPGATLTIAGEGPLRAALGELAAQLGVADRVCFAGFVSQHQLRELLYSSHLFLHPSETGTDGNQEGVPNAMLEAMASGLPVFATRHGGIPEAIDHGHSGILVSEGDADALAQALLDAVRDPARLQALAQAGAESVAENFEQGKQARRLEDCYLELIGNAAR